MAEGEEGRGGISRDTELCSERAEIFRSKLISDFHLLDIITEQGSQVEAPKFYTHDMLSEL